MEACPCVGLLPHNLILRVTSFCAGACILLLLASVHASTNICFEKLSDVRKSPEVTGSTGSTQRKTQGSKIRALSTQLAMPWQGRLRMALPRSLV